MVQMAQWDDLIQESERLVARTTQRPIIARDLNQVTQLAQQIASQQRNGDVSLDAYQAEQFLAQQGVQTRRLNDALQSVRMEVDDVVDTQNRVSLAGVGGSVGLGQFRHQQEEATLKQVIQEAEDMCHMLHVNSRKQLLQNIWQNEKIKRLGGGGGVGVWRGFSLRAGIATSPFVRGSTGAIGRSDPYGDVTLKLVMNEDDGGLSTGTVDEISEYLGAAQKLESETPSARGVYTPVHMWQTIQHIHLYVQSMREQSGGGGSVRLRGDTLLLHSMRGGRIALQHMFVDYMKSIVAGQRFRSDVATNIGPLGLVLSYLQVAYSNVGQLELRSGQLGSVCWLVVYHCLRAGYIQQAQQICQQYHLSCEGSGQDMEHVLETWYGDQCVLSGVTQQSCMTWCVQQAKEAKQRSPNEAFKLLVHCILCGDRSLLDTSSIECMLTNIEQWLWARLCMVRGDSGEGTSAGYALTDTYQPYTPAVLQQEIQQYNPEQYTGGSDHVRYIIVLLCTAHLCSAALYCIYQQPVHAVQAAGVHVALVGLHHGLLVVGDEGTNNSADGEQCADKQEGDIIQLCDSIDQYSKQFIQTKPQLSVIYTMEAASLLGSLSEHKVLLCRVNALITLLTTSNVYGTVFESGQSGSHSVLAKYLKDDSSYHELLTHAAQQCVANAQYNIAIELYQNINNINSVLYYICFMYSMELQQYFDQGSCGGIDALEAKGVRAIQSLRQQQSQGTSSSVAGTTLSGTRVQISNIDMFNMLRGLRNMIDALRHQQYHIIIQQAEGIRILPLEASRVDQCLLSVLHCTYRPLLDRLPLMLIVLSQALYHTQQYNVLTILVQFAKRCQGVPGGVVSQIAELASGGQGGGAGLSQMVTSAAG